MKVTEREFSCEMCGNTFVSTAHSARYCPDCRRKRKNMSVQKHKEKVASGQKVRRVGEEQVCEMCGNKFILRSGSQRFCENCQKKYRKEKKKEYNKANLAKTQSFIEENYDRIFFFADKGKKDELKEIAASQNISINKLIANALDFYLKYLSEKE